jgi:RNA-binding protein YlmH
MIEKKHILERISIAEDKIFVSRILDIVLFASSYKGEKFTFFLDENKKALALEALKATEHKNYLFFGGCENAVRTILGVFPPNGEAECSPFPIGAISITSKELKALSHRDFLGTLMSLGITREQVGDILLYDEQCIVLIIEDKIDYVINNITKIKNVGVTLKKLETDKILPPSQAFLEKNESISSPRIDTIVSTICHLSREKAKLLLQSGKVEINKISTAKNDALVKEKDILSIRGVGKFIIDSISPYGKKGKFRLIFRKYL